MGSVRADVVNKSRETELRSQTSLFAAVTAGCAAALSNAPLRPQTGRLMTAYLHG